MNIIISKPQCFSAQGKKENQEDSLFPRLGKATENTRVFMVCDGMGGHENGEVASACVAETIGSMTSALPLCSTEVMKKSFEEALQQAYHNLDELDRSNSIRKMGTTLTFLALCDDGVLVAHIGDSRVYQFRPNEGVHFQTRDHSLVNDLIAAGELNKEDARTFPQRNVITRAIQPHQEYPVEATFNILKNVQKGDLFFLCCDGVLEQLDDKDLCSFLLADKPLEDRLSAVEDACLSRDTRDNNTACLIEVVEVENGNPAVAEIKSVDDQERTVTRVIQEKTKTKKFGRFLILLVAILAVVFIVLKMADSPSDKGTTKSQNVTGIIQRDNK